MFHFRGAAALSQMSKQAVSGCHPLFSAYKSREGVVSRQGRKHRWGSQQVGELRPKKRLKAETHPEEKWGKTNGRGSKVRFKQRTSSQELET